MKASRVVLALSVVAVLAVAFGAIHLTRPAWYDRLWYPLKYSEIIRGHARNYRLDPALLAAVIYQESKFRADARSDQGAMGLMQLLPETAKGIALRTGGGKFTVADLWDPEINVRYGAWYLRHLLDKYRDEALALAAYNAGQRNVDNWLRRGVGVQFDETRHFVDRVQELTVIYRRAYRDRLGLAAAAARHLTDSKVMSY